MPINVVMVILGIFVFMMGQAEYELQSRSSAEPQAIELSDLEAGKSLPDIHLQIGRHWRVWDEVIYSYTVKEGEEVGPSTRVQYAFYPIISDGHPHSQVFDRLPAGYGSWGDVPAEEWPVLEDFSVLVRTDAYKKVGDIPGGTWTDSPGITGLVVNDVRKLDTDERSLLIQSHAGLDLDRVIVLEEGRRPESLASCLGQMAGGGLLSLAGLAWLYHAATGRRPGVAPLPPLLKAAEVA